MSYKISSVFSRLFVKRLSEDNKSGIIRPDASKKVSLVGRVVHVGPTCEIVNEGDMILFAKYSGVEVPIDPTYLRREDYEDVLVMNEEDILAILEEKTEAPLEGAQIAKEVAHNGKG